jgi:hypothetical protein
MSTSPLTSSAAVIRQAVCTASLAALLVVAGTAGAATDGGIPAKCPSASLVRSILKLKVSNTMSTITVPELPYGSPALPKKLAPLHQETCVYAANGKYSGTIVPTTISFSELHSTKEFAAARTAASVSVQSSTVRGLGDGAWIVNPPKGDPRAGASLFVLRGKTDIVISAPPQATNAELERLARTLLTIPLTRT